MAERPSYDDINSIIDQVYGSESEEVTPSEADDSTAVPVDEVTDTDAETTDDDQPEGLVEDESDAEDDDTTESDDADDESDDSDPDSDEEDSTPGLMDELVTVKVNGEEIQVTVEQAVKGFQLAAASNKKFEEAAKIREEASQAIEFTENFSRLWTEEPHLIVQQLVSEASDPNALVEAVVLRAAATGKLNPAVAEALGIDDDVTKKLSLEFERKELEQQKQAIEAERGRPATASEADEHGFTVEFYQQAFGEILATAGLSDSPVEDQKAFLDKVLQFGDQAGVANPYLAFAKYQQTEVQQTAVRKERAAKAAKKVSKESATASALAPKGRVQHAPTTVEISSAADAVEAALSDLESKYGRIS